MVEDEDQKGFDPLASFITKRERERERERDDDDASSDDRARLHISRAFLWSFFGDDRNL
jgi:hypothetical protein